jgi:5-formyltetrahydrofolate cyclo-ligase
MSGPKEKQAIREEVWRRMAQEGFHADPYRRIPSFPGQDKAAERLRRTSLYKESITVLVPPDQPLFQVRINLLQDRKRLIMATPGLRDGFYEIPGNRMPPSLWGKAVSSTGVKRYGRKIPTSFAVIGEVDLMVTGAVAVSHQGDRIGKGTGYFDLEYAILREIGSVREDVPIIAVVHDFQIFEELPWNEKDVSIGLIVTPTTTIPVPNPRPRPIGVDWPAIQGRQMRKMRPLWELGGSR